jgi:glycosyltransferase involved in cell wall biosynthesis
LKVAYLINQYPQPSHTFIRREIAGLEALGFSILRFSVRRTAGLLDPADLAEQQRTRALLSSKPAAFVLALAVTLLTRPLRFLRALGLTLRLGWRSERGVARHFAYLAEAALLQRMLDGEGVCHLHAHFGTNSTAVAMLCRELGGPGYSFTVHGPEEFDKAPILGMGEKIARAAFVVGVSDFGRSQLCRLTPPSGWSKLFVVRCGVDASFFTGARPCTAAPRLVCVARLGEQKGHLLLLDAVKKLRDQGVSLALTLVGDGPLRAAIEAKIHDLGLGECICLAGWMDERGVREAIAASRALVLPSFAEGLPVVLMEALALGRPVIATYVAGIPELVEPGRSGWLVPAGSVDALADALRDAVSAPPAALDLLGRHGAARVFKLHHSVNESRKLSALFRSVGGL